MAVRLEFLGDLVTVFASLFAIFARETISPGLAGLSISLSLNVSHRIDFSFIYFDKLIDIWIDGNGVGPSCKNDS